MSLIKKLTPNNLLEEKEKFFSDTSYNPQFQYDEEVEINKVYKYDKQDPVLIEKAQEIVDRAYHNTTETEIIKHDGKKMTQNEVDTKAKIFLKMHGLDNRFEVVWSSSFLSRATMSKTELKLKKGVEYREQDVIGMIYHEIGTHAIRRVNYEQQPWFRRKKKHGFSEYLPTEEGLAITHSLLPKQNKLAHSSAVRYLAVAISQQASFAELWSFLSKYIDDPEKRWSVCVRQKRGVSDTTQPGGFTKDSVYFAGFSSVSKWLVENDFDLESLYFGKMAIEDIEKAREMNPDFSPLLPSFYSTKPDVYAEQVTEIFNTNF